MCHLVQVSRSGFYRYLRERWPAEEELTLRSAIQDLVLEHRWRYGYRRVTAERMSRPTNPYDNATCESFLRTLKREQINATAYPDNPCIRSRRNS